MWEHNCVFQLSKVLLEISKIPFTNIFEIRFFIGHEELFFILVNGFREIFSRQVEFRDF
jgi:hypothetical protein